MSKTPSNKLFRLIKSLTGSEKRYFKIFIQRKGDKENKYIALFDEIDKQDFFDDDFLQKKIYKTEKIETRKYSELKGYLYDLILKSIQSYDEKTSVDYKLKGMILGIRSLFKRSLFEDCKEILRKAKKLALKYEAFSMTLELLSWEKQIAYTETDITYLNKEISRIDKEEKILLKQIKNIAEYRNIFFRLLIILRKDASPNKRKEVEKLIVFEEDTLMSNIQNASSYRAKVLFYRVLSLYHYAKQDLVKFYSSSTLLIEQIESEKHMLEEDVSEYISALSNHIVASGSSSKLKEVERILDKIRLVKPKTIDDAVKVHRQYYTSKFRLCISSGRFEEGYLELQKHLKDIKYFNPNLFNKNNFYLHYFIICFGVEKYDEALNHLNVLLNMPKNIERQDVQSLARILNLIIHYEMKNSTLLNSLMRSTFRFLKEKNFLEGFEKKFLNSLREATEIQSRKELKNHWILLKQEYDRLEANSNPPAILRWFPIGEWIESKIKGKSFADVVRANFLKNHPK